jgi:hypothetical protein
MRLRPRTLIAISSLVLLSCESVYDYHYRTPSNSAPDIHVIAGRLSGVLEPQGFKALTFANDDLIPQVGGTGYLSCPNARDLVVFLRDRSGRTSVHLYACQGEARLVIVADSWVEDEPGRTRDLLNREFADEFASGAVILEHRHRVALE